MEMVAQSSYRFLAERAVDVKNESNFFFFKILANTPPGQAQVSAMLPTSKQ
jgi:hypothetical protein